jgi:type VI secretion system secreted protein VgrG
MSTYTQAVRPLRVTTPLGPDALLLVGLSGHEAISRLFQFRLDTLAENETPVPFEALLGQKVTVVLGFPDEDVRYLSGICARIGQAGRDQTFTAYHLEIVPQLWFLTRIAQSRIFQQLTVPEILAQVLKGLDVDLHLTGPYEPRDFCVQYRETDFNFASRLMEEEGIFYFFRHSARGHTLVVADSPASFPELPEPLIFDEAFSGGNRDEERIGSWEKLQELRSGKVTLWDHCFELPHKHLEAQKTIQDSVAAGQVTHKLKIDGSDKLELYDYPGEYAQRFDGVNPAGGDRPADVQKILTDNQRTVELRMQEEAAAGLVIRGSGNVRALTSGSKFTLQRHHDADGSYLLTGVEHSARLSADYRSGDPDPYHYSAGFTCIPAALPYRPARATPRPFVQGTQTAVVVGPPGEEIFTDKYGRVKVQFHWDRQGRLDASSSCWIRVAQIAAGGGFGGIHIPRVGQEVVVAFEEGDPDQPIVVGSVYNPAQMSPYGLPGKKMVSGLKSNTYPGGGGYNEIIVDDTKGNELIRVHGQHDMDSTIEHDLREHVLNDRHRDVTNNETVKIGVDQSEDVGRNQALTVGKNRTKTVGVDQGEVIGSNKTIQVGANHTESIGANMSQSVGANQAISVGANKTETVAIASAESVGAAKALSIGAAYQVSVGAIMNLTVAGAMLEEIGAYRLEAVGGHKEVTIGGDMDHSVSGKHVQKAQEITITAATKITLMCGASSITLDAGTITIKGPLVKINC